jgi:hypothetical protein
LLHRYLALKKLSILAGTFTPWLVWGFDTAPDH